MPYLVKYGNEVLFQPGDDERQIYGASISQKADGVSTFTFTVPPGHPVLDSMELRDFANMVEVTFDGKSLFRGVVTSMTTDIRLQTTVSCRSELLLLEGVLTRYAPTDKRASTALAELLSIYENYINYEYGEHNDAMSFTVDPESQAHLVGYEDPTSGRLIVDAEAKTPTSILEIIRHAILEPYGAFIRTRRDASGRMLIGLYPQAPDSSTQVVQLGENLLDYAYTESDDGMYNACVPVGGSVEERTGAGRRNVQIAQAAAPGDRYLMLRVTSGTTYVDSGESIIVNGKYGFVHEIHPGEGYTIVITNEPTMVRVDPPVPVSFQAGLSAYINGRAMYSMDGTQTGMGTFDATLADGFRKDYDIVYHFPSARANGIRCFTFQDSSILDADVLVSKAMAMVKTVLEPTRSLTVKALDMAFYLPGYSHLTAGEKLRVVSEPHGLDTVMYVRTARIDLDDPSRTEYVLGTTESAVTKAIRRTNANVRLGSDNLIKEMNNRISSATVGGLS